MNIKDIRIDVVLVNRMFSRRKFILILEHPFTGTRIKIKLNKANSFFEKKCEPYYTATLNSDKVDDLIAFLKDAESFGIDDYNHFWEMDK